MRQIDADALKELFSEVIGRIAIKPEMNGNLEHMIRASAMVIQMIDDAPTVQPEQQWIPCSERFPSKEERKEWIDKNLGGIGYLYPCLVTRYSSNNPDRTTYNPYVAKHYYDGEDFINNGEEVCSEYIVAWMPLPEPYKEGGEVDE